MTSHELTRDPMPARLAVGVISAGRVGTALGEALAAAGHPVVACSAVSDASVGRATTRLPDAAILPPPEVAERSELLVLAVPDTELPGLARGLAACGAVRPGTIVAHTSGTYGISVLEPLVEAGALALALHPAMTFLGSAEDTERLRSACFGVTAADATGSAVAQALVLEIGAEPVPIPEQDRALYHAALAHGANHLVTLVVDAVAALEAALGDVPGLERRATAQRMVAPLLSAALDNVLRRGQSALTGPVARGDSATVARHLDALGEVDPEIANGYRALARRTAQQSGAGVPMFDVLDGRQGQ
ncbi:Rossmann-like and DUF2520 domain-containing protein [Lolliginicoccus levis]|uniref:Rossmann-like and DUF2520 domain-containing protein n=1 Tax=Lolliginicoccus levis TaxID=2919542 RepID=UPI0035A26130